MATQSITNGAGNHGFQASRRQFLRTGGALTAAALSNPIKLFAAETFQDKLNATKTAQESLDILGAEIMADQSYKILEGKRSVVFLADWSMKTLGENYDSKLKDFEVPAEIRKQQTKMVIPLVKNFKTVQLDLRHPDTKEIRSFHLFDSKNGPFKNPLEMIYPWLFTLEKLQVLVSEQERLKGLKQDPVVVHIRKVLIPKNKRELEKYKALEKKIRQRLQPAQPEKVASFGADDINEVSKHITKIRHFVPTTLA